MNRVNKFICSALLFVGVIFSITGCANTTSEQKGPVQNQDITQSEAKITVPTKENPLVINKEEGIVLFAAEVNGKYLYEATRHGAVYKEGSNGNKALFRGLTEPEAFYNALIEIGAKPGNNMTLDNKEKTHVQGDALDVKLTWQGADKDYDINDVVKDSNGNPIEMHFGGNLTNAQDKKTGCLLCLDSCPVGIGSNTTYTYGAVEKRDEVTFVGNKDILPADGTLVIFKVTLKK